MPTHACARAFQMRARTHTHMHTHTHRMVSFWDLVNDATAAMVAAADISAAALRDPQYAGGGSGTAKRAVTFM